MEMLTIRDAMTRDVVTVEADAQLKDVARVLIDAGVSGLPVVDPPSAPISSFR